jgi:hypothetical protein
LNCGETKQAYDVSLEFEVVDLSLILDNLEKKLHAYPKMAANMTSTCNGSSVKSRYRACNSLPSCALACSCGARGGTTNPYLILFDNHGQAECDEDRQMLLIADGFPANASSSSESIFLANR